MKNKIFRERGVWFLLVEGEQVMTSTALLPLLGYLEGLI